MHGITSGMRSEFTFSGFVVRERSALGGCDECANRSPSPIPALVCPRRAIGEFSLRNVVSSIGVLPGEKRLGGAWRVRHDDDGGGRQWHSETTCIGPSL